MTIERKLVDMIDSGNLAAARQLIDVGRQVGLNINDAENNMPILHSAVLSGIPQIVELILEQPELNINALGGDVTAVHLAARQKTPEILTMLLNGGAKCQLQSRLTHIFPIIEAAKFGCHENIQLLLDKEVNLAAKDNDELEALDYVLQRGRDAQNLRQQAKEVFDRACKIAIFGSSTYQHAFDAHYKAQQILKQSVDVLLVLLRNGAGIGRDHTELHDAMVMDMDGCYSLDNVPCTAIIDLDDPQPFLIENSPEAVQCYKLRRNAPLNQFILRCAERLHGTDSNNALRQLERYFVFATGKITLKYLCSEQIIREPNALALIAQLPVANLVPHLTTLANISLYGTPIQRESAICQNRLEEFTALTRHLDNRSDSRFIRNTLIMILYMSPVHLLAGVFVTGMMMRFLGNLRECEYEKCIDTGIQCGDEIYRVFFTMQHTKDSGWLATTIAL